MTPDPATADVGRSHCPDDGRPQGAWRSGALVSDRRYRFDEDRAGVWGGIGSVEQYPTWWPWLRRFRGAGMVVGDVWTCQIQPPMPYSLRFTVSVDQVVPFELVTASIAGDVRGSARLELEDAGSGCRVRIRSTLVPASLTLRTMVRLASPVARHGHSWVLDTGARQFADRPR